ncbi:MAG: class I adenylate-forming enzyme family protein [Acidimicrobiales bacterium]|nr:class I adenylate-forming enzyme family protein [Acidimicrobiales bacterium]
MPDLASRLAGHASATALLEGDARVSYAELSDRVYRTAGALHTAGLSTGARVALLADPTVDGVVGYLGVQAAGMVPVMLSARSPLPELERRYNEINPDFTLYGATIECALPANVSPFRPVGSDATDFPLLNGDAAASRASDYDDPAVVLYTSGVSGLPRPIVLTYGNLEATRNGLVNAPGSGLDAATVVYAGLSISHVFGLNSVVGTVLSVGGKLVLHSGFDPHEVAEQIARHRITAISVVPLMWKALAAAGDRELFATVTRATYAAAPMPPTVLEAVREMIGVEVAGGFGLTETAGTICHDDPTDPHPGTVGVALSDTEIRVVADGADALLGDVGEIWLRGPSVATSYLDGSPLDGAQADGWLRTGDIGMFDDLGRLDIVDRKKDVININGFNVSPAEVEVALEMHPGVSSSVVVGDVEDDKEVVIAHVVPRPGETVTENELVEHCRAQLSRYKVPAHVFLHRELPITESGKAVRRLLGRSA